MVKQNPTSVVLTKAALEIKEDLAPIFGLKNILSAGLLLFGRLSDTQQKAIIAQANGYELPDPSQRAAESARLCIKTYQGLSAKDFAVSLSFLSDRETRAVKKMLDSLQPSATLAAKRRKKA